MNISNEIALLIRNIKKNKPISIAFDGVDTSGKTTLADNVYKILHSQHENVIRISIDKFHNTKEIRMAKGILSPDGFFEDSFNIEKIIEFVFDPLKNNKGTIITGIFDYKKEAEIEQNKIKVEPSLIVLFDGIFLNRDELHNYWDFSIFLDVTFETVLKRALKRDLEYFGSEEEVNKRYKKRYIPGEEIYLKKCNPRERADIVIDNNDWKNPIILKGEKFLTTAST